MGCVGVGGDECRRFSSVCAFMDGRGRRVGGDGRYCGRLFGGVFGATDVENGVLGGAVRGAQ